MLSQHLIDRLQTPCLVIDMAQAKRNIAAMQTTVEKTGTRLRPHIKTHKMVRFALLQQEAGAAGITCAKVSEAEVMARGGIEDIFIAYPQVGSFRIRRAIALAGRIRRLILAVDSSESARLLQEAAAKADVTLEVRLEVDTGASRTGVPYEQAVALATEIAGHRHLRLTGIYTFKSLIYQHKPTGDAFLAAEEEGQLMASLAQAMREAGLVIEEISGGSTPTAIDLAKTQKVDEVRPGTYIFNDYMLYKKGVASLDAIAVRMYATVVSCPTESLAVIDGGTKFFPTDIALGSEYPGYAIIEGDENLRLVRMNEEHGMIEATDGHTALKVGQVISLIPIHVCTAINMQNTVYLFEDGHLIEETVDGRGMLV